ncbi:hypothetical protein ACFOWX_00460 [Sphingorhabdus arenilitoris]|uniref:DUF7847 domain-containing protein n=1 Tax=Sphingorhabdus arenilitoris TaxID=1490041 RepID=A0ABV8RDC8_9SPHN
MKRDLDFTAAWNDAVAMMKQHQSLVLPIAGLFIFLPGAIFAVMMPPPEIDAAMDPGAQLAMLTGFLSAMAPWLFVMSILGMVGNLAIYHLVLGNGRPTVGEALGLAMGSFLTLFLAGLMSTIAITLGLILLIIPGVYLAIKFSLIGPAIAGEGIKSPIEALSRSWNLTKGNSLRIFGFFLIIGIVGGALYLVASLVAGGLLGLISATLASVVDTVFSTILSVVFLFVVIAVYKQMAASDVSNPIR